MSDTSPRFPKSCLAAARENEINRLSRRLSGLLIDLNRALWPKIEPRKMEPGFYVAGADFGLAGASLALGLWKVGPLLISWPTAFTPYWLSGPLHKPESERVLRSICTTVEAEMLDEALKLDGEIRRLLNESPQPMPSR